MRKLERCFDAILTDEPQAPEAVIEMSLCKCNTGCSTIRCKCKNSLVVQKRVYVLDVKTLPLASLFDGLSCYHYMC